MAYNNKITVTSLTSPLATGLLKSTTGTGELTIAVNSDLPAMTSTVGGAVPTPPNNTTTFLRGDGTFAVPAGGVSDGDKGDIVVSASGATWTIDSLAVTNAKVNDVSVAKLTSGTVAASLSETIASTSTRQIKYSLGETGFVVNDSNNSISIFSKSGSQAVTVDNTSTNVFHGTTKTEFVSGVMRIWDSNLTNYVGIQPPTTANLSANYTLTLPTTAGSLNQVLATDGTGVLSWATPSSGGITTLNTLTAATQTFAMGTTAQTNDIGWVSSTSTHTLHIPNASSTDRGVITTAAQTIAGLKTFSGTIAVGAVGGTSGAVNYIGTTSGNVTMSAPASGVGWTLVLPGGAGTANQFLQTNGSGTTSWASVNFNRPYVAKTAAYTLVAATDYFVEWTSGTVAATLPTAVSGTGREFVIKNTGTGIITINTTSSQTIDGTASGVIVLNQYDSIHVYSNGTNWLVI